MAKRPAFLPRAMLPFVERFDVEFQWFAGFAVSQAQRSIASMHDALSRRDIQPALEISTKSPAALGVELSAFNLLVRHGDLELSVESAFQGSKVFSSGGPFHDLYEAPSGHAKRDPRLRSSGDVIGFDFLGDVWPTTPTTGFYDWLYMSALARHREAHDELPRFNAFTDIAFNPKKSLNCQARSAATFVGLVRTGLLDRAVENRDAFLSLVYSASDESATQQAFFGEEG